MNIKVVLLRGRETIAEHRQISKYTSQSGDAIPWKNKNGVLQQGLAKQIQSNHKFHDATYFIKGATYDIV